MFGRLGSILGIGAVPVFARSGGAPGGTRRSCRVAVPPGWERFCLLFGSGGSVLFPGAAAGGTPPFVPSSSKGGGAGMGAAPAAGGIFSKVGLASMLPGLKSFFGFGENDWVNMSGGRMASGGWISQYGSFGDKLQALGKSNAALMAGGLLAMDGLRRGGYAGLAETTAGGALIGYKFGGPLGAAIGAAAGAVAGIVRLFVKGATEKTKEQDQGALRVDTSDQGGLKQIVDMTKSRFGGNIGAQLGSGQGHQVLPPALERFERIRARCGCAAGQQHPRTRPQTRRAASQTRAVLSHAAWVRSGRSVHESDPHLRAV